jgi:hypothetical protein
MKPPVSPAQTPTNNSISAPLGVIWLAMWLIIGLSACSSAGNKPADVTPIAQPSPMQETTAVMAEQQAKKQSLQQPAQQSVRQKAIRLRDGHPRQYTVKKGDTLWDISSMFLKDPWYWPEVWHKNRQVKNPHLIYPGDVLTLIYVDKQPQIVVAKPVQTTTTRIPETATEEGLRVVKLGPSIRREGLDASVPTIPGDAIRQFLTRPRIVTEEELENAPYILASEDDHLILGQDNRIYVRGELDKDRVRFTVFRPGEELIDPETDETLGYEAIYAGEAHIIHYDDPAVAVLTSTEREVLLGDRLLPLDKSKINNLYFPKVPDREVKGQIVSLFDALFGVGKFQIAVINRGTRDGIEVGHLLATLTSGATIDDNFNLRGDDEIKLPNERSGLMMIFRTFNHASYGLIMESTRVIRNHDVVVTPR